MVYSREEYAKKEFWDDRFKETKGFFDWYANWDEIKPVFDKFINHGKDLSEEEIKQKNSQTSILMVGNGNSKLSEHMAIKDNYRNIVNTDISQVVNDKMKEHTNKFPECSDFEYLTMDAT